MNYGPFVTFSVFCDDAFEAEEMYAYDLIGVSDRKEVGPDGAFSCGVVSVLNCGRATGEFRLTREISFKGQLINRTDSTATLSEQFFQHVWNSEVALVAPEGGVLTVRLFLNESEVAQHHLLVLPLGAMVPRRTRSSLRSRASGMAN
jgi:hypothetical protein